METYQIIRKNIKHNNEITIGQISTEAPEDALKSAVEKNLSDGYVRCKEKKDERLLFDELYGNLWELVCGPVGKAEVELICLKKV